MAVKMVLCDDLCEDGCHLLLWIEPLVNGGHELHAGPMSDDCSTVVVSVIRETWPGIRITQSVDESN